MLDAMLMKPFSYLILRQWWLQMKPAVVRLAAAVAASLAAARGWRAAEVPTARSDTAW